jgi:hypothetical protein
VAAAVQTLAGRLVRVSSTGRSKARARHTMRCRESLSQVSNIGRLGIGFCKAAWPVAAVFRSRKLHAKAPDFGRGRGRGFWIVGCPGNEEVGRGNTVRWRVPRRVGKGAAKHGSFEGAGTGWKDEEVDGERRVGSRHAKRSRAGGARPQGRFESLRLGGDLISAVGAAGVRPDDGASSDCRAARASAAGTVDAFGAHDAAWT